MNEQEKIEILNKVYNRIKSTFYSVNEDDLFDIYQEVYIKISKKDYINFSYTLAIFKNLIYDFFRKNKREINHLENLKIMNNNYTTQEVNLDYYGFTDLQKNIIDLKVTGVDVLEIIKTLNISKRQYYKNLDLIKEVLISD